MSDFFDFLGHLSPYAEDNMSIVRLNKRRKLIVDPFVSDLSGARVLDLACHDGRWAYALAHAGAAEVVGVEARQTTLNRFEQFPETDFKKRITLTQGDLFDALEAHVAKGESFDVVAVFGIFYHIMDHMRLLKLVRELGPKLIVIDGSFLTVPNAEIQVLREDTFNPLNAVTDVNGRTETVIGVPSMRAMRFMAEAINYRVEWLDHEKLMGPDRAGIRDYDGNQRNRRRACALRPV